MNVAVKLSSFFLYIFAFKGCWIYWCFCVAFVLFFYILFGTAAAILFFSLFIFALLFNSQDELLYHPDKGFVQTPLSVNLPFENLFIKSADGTVIHLYFVKRPIDCNLVPTIIFLHGNAGNMGHRLHNAAVLYESLKCNLLMVEYRGYGQSKGRVSEKGLCMDAQAALDYLSSRQDVDLTQIIIFGRSLGGAVAIDLAARPEYGAKIWCIILENTFTSIPDMAMALFRKKIFQLVPLCFYKNKFLSKNKINCVVVPVLFISGLRDTLVPPSMMDDLYNRCQSMNKYLLRVPAGGHNDTWTCPGYFPSIAAFLGTVAALKPVAVARQPSLVSA